VDSAEEPWYTHGSVTSPSPRTRWTRMLTAPSRAWRVCQQICAEHWEAWQHAHPRSQTPYDKALVAQRLAWGHPATIGDTEARCLHCGQGTPLVAMRCPASLGVRCAPVAVDTWVSQGSTRLHAGVSDRPSLLTVPALCRTPCSQHAAGVWSAGMRCGAPCLDEVSRPLRGTARQGGAITVLQTQGRTGPYPPPLPLLATRGGYEAQGARGEPLQSVPAALRRRQWPWPLLPRRRQTRKSAAITPWGDRCVRQ
jgi:hypothetical protein